MRKDAKLELLRQVPLFAGCTKKELGEISTLADELSLPAGTKLIEEGRQGHEFFLLVDGRSTSPPRGASRRRWAPAPSSARWRSSRTRPRNATVTATTPGQRARRARVGLPAAPARLAPDPAQGPADARRPRRRERAALNPRRRGSAIRGSGCRIARATPEAAASRPRGC